MGLIIKGLIAIFVISLILILLDRSVFVFIEENLPFVKELEGMETIKEEPDAEKERTQEDNINDSKVESLASADPKTDLSYSHSTSFCRVSDDNLDEQDERCKKLTKSNCKQVDCCILLNGAKCVAGNSQGPSFKTDTNTAGNDYYYFKNKCYGKCPK